jgi:hypothetical protein
MTLLDLPAFWIEIMIDDGRRNDRIRKEHFPNEAILGENFQLRNIRLRSRIQKERHVMHAERVELQSFPRLLILCSSIYDVQDTRDSGPVSLIPL